MKASPAPPPFPPPPPGRSGWPWLEQPATLPAAMPDGSPWPRISVVTPSYNQGRFIEETIRSVLLQGYPNLEYIVVDGGSADESVAVIGRYAPWLSFWVSEPDRGQSHAINKGLARCTGEIFNWINSDDLLAPGALAAVAAAFAGHDAVAGVGVNFDQAGREERVRNYNLTIAAMVSGREPFDFHQPSLWLRRRGLEACGGIDEQFQYAFDWEMFMRYLALSPRVRYLPAVLARFRLHDSSKTVSQAPRFEEEHHRIAQKLSDHPHLGRAYRGRRRRLGWWAELDQIMGDSRRSRWGRTAAIALGIARDPSVRLSRFSLGALRRALLARP